MKRIRQVAEVNPTCPEFDSIDDDEEIAFFPLEAVWPGKALDSSRRRVKGEVASGYTRFRTGDIVVPKITPTFEASRTATIPEVPFGVAAGTTELHVVRVQASHPGYIWYLFHSLPFLLGGKAEMTGVAGQKRVPDDWIRNTAVPVLDLDEQRRIAEFLDTETARIDALIKARQRLGLLLDEKRSATVRTEMSFPPESMTRIRYVAKVKRGQSPRPITDPQYFDDNGSHGWVRIEDVTRSSMYLRHTKQRLSELGKSRSVPVGPGEVLVSIAASVGKPIITALDCCYHDGFVGLLHLKADPEFAYHWLSLPERFAGMEQIGTQANINSDIVGSVRFPVASMDDQRSIAARINARIADIDRLMAAVERQLALLLEYRQALITAAVTGQLDDATLNGSRPIDDDIRVEVSG